MAKEIPEIDLLFIDGDHSYAACSADLRNYLPKLKPNGLLLFHDFNYPEVQRACKEALANRPARAIDSTHSLQAYQMLG